MSKKNHLLIDGDGVVFTICVGLEHEVRWDENIHTIHSNLEEAIDAFEKYTKHIMHALDGGKLTFVFSSKTNFRKTVDPTYKGHRKKTRKPLAYGSMLEYVWKHYDSVECTDLEADDVLGIMATNGKNPNNIIVSDDKDLLTIPTRVYRLGELHDVTVEQADYNWLKQTLTGDVADGYKGCPGIGDKSAAKLLEIPTWETVVKAYTKAGLGQAEALVQARLARILRAEDYVDDAVILWSPNDTVTT